MSDTTTANTPAAAITLRGNRLRAGLGWDPTQGLLSMNADLDLRCYGFSPRGTLRFSVTGAEPVNSKYGCRHSGDNTTGKGDGDDEFILVNLEKLLATDIETVVFTVNGQSHHHFARLQQAFFRVVDQNVVVSGTVVGQHERGRINLSAKDACAMVVAVLRRTSDRKGWAIEVLPNGPTRAVHTNTHAELVKMAMPLIRSVV